MYRHSRGRETWPEQWHLLRACKMIKLIIVLYTLVVITSTILCCLVLGPVVGMIVALGWSMLYGAAVFGAVE